MVNKVNVSVKPVKTSIEDNNTKADKTMDIVFAIKPAFIMDKLLGLSSFDIDGNVMKPNDTRRKLKGIAVPISVLIVYATIYGIWYFDTSKSPTDEVYIFDLIHSIPPLAILFTYVVLSIITLFCFSETNIKIFSAMNKIDSILLINVRAEMLTIHRRRLIKIYIALVLSLILTACNEYYQERERIEYIRLMILPLNFFQATQTVNFCNVVFMLKQRLQIINNHLENIINAKNGRKKGINYVTQATYKKVTIRELAWYYDSVGETCSDINTVFNFNLLSSLVMTFIYVIITIWTTLWCFLHGINMATPLLLLFSSGSGGVCSLIAISVFCQMILATREETKVLVNEIIMDYNLPSSSRIAAKNFMELVEAWPLIFAVYDMFNIDITLLLKFMSVCITYLIMIIQISHFKQN